MDKPVKVEFRWTEEEMLRAQRLHLRYSAEGRRLRRIFIGGGTAFFILGFAGFAKGQAFLAAGLPLFLVGGAFLALPLWMRRAVLKIYAQKPDRDMVVTYEISAERILTRSEVASTDMLWRTIIRAHRIPEGFLLYPTDRMFHWLPAHGFQNAAELERLAQIARSNVKEYKDAVAA